MNFRADINGLRAIAVLAVIAFHFGLTGMKGGFVGVDIFFVISGYLMTGIVVGKLDRGSFSLANFYLDRGRRIFPPLAVMVCTVMLLGGWLLLPQDLLSLGKQAISAISFWSNMLFWREHGYFDQKSALKFLLHTWSLSVEWQFYLAYPLMLMGLNRIGARRWLAPLLALAALASCALCLWLSPRQPTAAFFLLPARAWEMLLGGLAFILPTLPDRWSRAGQIGGLVMIAAALFTAQSDNWPGPLALLPTMGAALVIAAGRKDSRLTGNGFFTWMGRNSYSIYLWHWPLAVLLTRSGHSSEAPWMAAGMAGSILLGHLSWRWVEQAGKSGKEAGQPRLYSWRQHAVLVLPMLAIMVAGSGFWLSRGLPQRFSAEVQALEAEALPGGPYTGRCFVTKGAPPKPCLLGPDTEAQRQAAVIFMGDSQSENEVNGLIAALPKDGHSAVVYHGYAACPPLLGAISTNPESRCSAFLDTYLTPLTKPRQTPLVLTAYWLGILREKYLAFGSRDHVADAGELRRQILNTSCALAKGGPTYLVLPTPDFPWPVVSTLQHALIDDPKAADLSMPLARHQAEAAPIISAMQEAQKLCGVRLLDPTPAICPDGKACTASRGHRALFRDTHHMTEYGNQYLTPMFAQIFSH